MLDVPPPQPYYTGPGIGRSSTGRVPKLQVVVAAGLLVTVFLPWIRWGSAYSQYGASFGISNSLWDVVSHSSETSVGWMLLFAAGVAFALLGSLLEAIKPMAGQMARWIALGGFVTSVGAAVLGLVTGVDNLGFDSSSTGIGLTTSLDFGFWLGLGIAAAGTLISLMHVAAPSNPARPPATLVLSPWGPPTGTFPATYNPAPGYAGPGHTVPGHVPPGFEAPGFDVLGYLPPAYGPAVYPMPGHMTSAYPMPGQSGAPDSATPTPVPRADPASATGGEAAPTGTPTPGHLVVLEAGRSTTLVVQPGERLLVGRDPDARIRVLDPRVSARHATIERRGNGWAVQDVDATNPTRLIDPWGMSRTVRGETTISSGQIVVGDVTVTLYPNQV